ncbi:OmpA/MotB family protein [Candidatus Magnetaquicoccus inordinatus]|uniref:OmpA/MotB family protein n=1 Tax=Candidatus Magnetaquicoccus inordinatus TaxID=2496818 RepID=UPI00102C561D|nr:OmpA family protein [Candidatus Magnetaquicoccus inordinatus]
MAKVISRVQREIEDGGNPFWISYADLMTALAMLFLVVMSIAIVAIATRPMVEKQERESAIEVILNRLEERAKEKNLGLEINRATHTISFGEKASFAFNSYQLSAAAQESLRSFVPLLLELEPPVASAEERNWLKRIHIEGYTDSSGSYLYNVNLSLNRAQAVVCALFSVELPQAQQEKLRQLLIIDGASVTGIKQSAEESRRVEVRLEFRQPDDRGGEVTIPPTMPLGRCAIHLDEAAGANEGRRSEGRRYSRSRAVVQPEVAPAAVEGGE